MSTGFRLTISRKWLRGVPESAAERNTTTKENSTLVRSRCQIFGASWPIAKHRVPLRPIVLEYRCSRQISPIRRDHTSLFLRKCSSTRKGSLAFSLLLPLRRHKPSEVPEPCARAETRSFLRDRRSTRPRKYPRLEFLPACPNHGTAFLQNIEISARRLRGQYWLSPVTRLAQTYFNRRVPHFVFCRRVVGSNQASATRSCLPSGTSCYPATIRIDKDFMTLLPRREQSSCVSRLKQQAYT